MNTLSGLREAFEAQRLSDEAFEGLRSKIEAFDPKAQDQRTFYLSKVLNWLPGFTDGEIEILAPLIKDRLDISRDALFRDVRTRRKQASIEKNDKSTAKKGRPAHWPNRPIHPALDFDLETGFASVGVYRPEGYGLIVYHPETGAAWHPIESVKDFVSPTPFEYQDLMNRWPEKDLKAFLEVPVDRGFANTAALVIDLYQTHLEMTQEELFSLETAWDIGSCFFPIVPTYPRLHHNGEPGSGKTKIQRIKSNITFNGLFRLCPTLAVLFRLIQTFRASLCLDEIESLDSDERKELLALINAGYQRGGRIDRCEGDNNLVTSYSVYSPMSLSGIKGLNPTTSERCIFVNMRKGLDRARLNTDPSKDEPKIQTIRANCHRLALTRFRDVAAAFDALVLPEWLNGRDRELWAPLIAIGSLIDQEADLGLTEDLLKLADAQVKEREGLSLESEETLSLIEERLGQAENMEIRPVRLCEPLEERLRVKDLTPQKIGHILKRLGFRKLPRDREGVRYLAEKNLVEDLRKRYGGVGGEKPT